MGTISYWRPPGVGADQPLRLPGGDHSGKFPGLRGYHQLVFRDVAERAVRNPGSDHRPRLQHGDGAFQYVHQLLLRKEERSGDGDQHVRLGHRHARLRSVQRVAHQLLRRQRNFSRPGTTIALFEYRWNFIPTADFGGMCFMFHQLLINNDC